MDINKIAKNIDTEKKFPPVHLWNPKICPGVSFKIDRNGNWYYQGSIISKHKLKLLFASILKKENNKYYCVTPVEKVLVEVDLAPYMIIDFRIDNDTYIFDTNLNYSFALKDTQISFLESNEEIVPIIDVRDSIKGFFSRNIYYELINTGYERDGALYIKSANQEYCFGKL